MRSDIQALREDFYHAHYAMSFTPDVRADQCVKDFSDELDADLAELGANQGNYATKYVGYLRTWAARKSRCMSPMITGPANFPVGSNLKRMNSEQRAWEDFRAWRERYIRRANAVKTKSPEEDLDDALLDLEKQRAYHEMMIGVNRIVRSKATEVEKKERIIEEYDLSEKTVSNLFDYEPPFRPGFQSYTLTNHNAKIKRLEEKVLIMKARILRKETWEPIAFPGGTIDIENDRVVIRHDEKPAREVISALKESGFRWSPNWKCWCRKHTGNAVAAAKRVCGV
jgi:hypothetical protein